MVRDKDLFVLAGPCQYIGKTLKLNTSKELTFPEVMMKATRQQESNGPGPKGPKMDSKVCAGSQRRSRFGKWDPKPKISFFCGEAAHDHRPRSGWDGYRDGLMKVRVNKYNYSGLRRVPG